MSYNITGFDVKKNSLRIAKTDMEKLLGIKAKNFEYNPATGKWKWGFDYGDCEISGHSDKDYFIVDKLYFSSDFSGNNWSDMEQHWHKFKGELKVTIVWEGGDSIQHFHIIDGQEVKRAKKGAAKKPKAEKPKVPGEISPEQVEEIGNIFKAQSAMTSDPEEKRNADGVADVMSAIAKAQKSGRIGRVIGVGPGDSMEISLGANMTMGGCVEEDDSRKHYTCMNIACNDGCRIAVLKDAPFEVCKGDKTPIWVEDK